MADLAEVRQDFIRLSNRYDLLASGDLSANVDNGANAILNAGLRYLDSKVRHKKSVKKFVKVLSIGDYTFTVPDYITLEQLRMITATEEVDLTRAELSMREFRNTYGRPYSTWTNGVPAAWAVNNDILVDEMESSIPQSALGQDDVRVIFPRGELLRNASFDDPLFNALPASSFSELAGSKATDARYWDREDIDVVYDEVNKTMVVNGSFTAADVLIRQNVSDMLQYPNTGDAYTVSIVISGYTSGILNVELGISGFTGINANGTWTREINPNNYEVEPYLRVYSGSTDTIDLTIDSMSLKKIDVDSQVGLSPAIPFVDVEGRVGIIFNPPTDVARTVEFYARFFTLPMTRDTDRNYWTDSYPILLAMAGAYILEKRNQSSARVKYWLEAMEPEIFEIEADTIEDEMNAMENAHERTR